MVKDFESGGAGGAVAPFSALRLDFAGMGDHRFGPFRAEDLNSLRGLEKFDHVIDGGNTLTDFLQQDGSSGFFRVGICGGDPVLVGLLKVLCSRKRRQSSPEQSG